MANKYLLPCHTCDHQFEVEVGQAGQELTCPRCDSQTMVPTMGQIRKLEMVETTAPRVAIPEKTGHQGLKGWLFAGGLTLFILALAAGIALWFYAESLITRVDVEALVQSAVEPVDQLSPGELWDYWHEMVGTTEALPEWQETVTQGQTRQGEYLLIFAYALFGIAAVGLFSMLASFAIKRKRGALR